MAGSSVSGNPFNKARLLSVMSVALKREIEKKCSELDIPLVGFAAAKSWDDPPFEPWVPWEFRPGSIIPGTKTVIVIGLPIPLPVVETAPSIFYHEMYKTVNTLLDINAYRISLYLNTRGFSSVPVPRDGYGSVSILKESPLAFFSHRHAAYLAGLGNFGVNNVVLTPEFGPRIRFTSVFTTADIPPGKVMEKSLCIKCMRCVEICPVKALEGREYPAGLTNKKACATRSEALARKYIAPCGFCIKVCPVGQDRDLYERSDMSVYDNENQDTGLHRAWNHVRSYGGGKDRDSN
jgi:epoxyqueuosine reductase